MTGLIGLLITTIFGVVTTFLFSLRFEKMERLALGILLGFGLQTYITFIAYLFGLKYTFINSLLEVGILTVTLVALSLLLPGRIKFYKSFFYIDSFKSYLKLSLLKFKASNITTKFFVLVILFNVISSLLIGAFLPVYGWDSLVLYDFRAITFVATGGMADGIARGYFFGYPLMTSLAHMWMYFFNGNPHVFYWGLYIAFIVVLYRCLKDFLSLFNLQLTVLVLITLPFIYTGSYFDYTNFPYLVYLLASILYLGLYVKKKNSNYLIISVFLVAISTWIRQTEPFWVINLVFILVLEAKEFLKKPVPTLFLIVLSLIIFFGIQQPWRLYETSMIGGGRNVTDQVGYAVKSAVELKVSNLIDVISTTINKTMSTWQPYLYIAIFSAIFMRKNLSKTKIYLFILVANISLLLFGTYVFSLIWPEGWKGIIDSQQRLSAFIIPLLIIFSSIMADEYIINGRNVLNKLLSKWASRTFNE